MLQSVYQQTIILEKEYYAYAKNFQPILISSIVVRFLSFFISKFS